MFINWSIACLQCCVSFRCTAKWFTHTHTHTHKVCVCVCVCIFFRFFSLIGITKYCIYFLVLILVLICISLIISDVAIFSWAWWPSVCLLWRHAYLSFLFIFQLCGLFLWNWVVWAVCCCLVTKSWLTLCKPMDCSPPGSSVYGISQVRILEWVAISFFRGSSWPRDQTHISCIGKRILYHWGTREAPKQGTLS